MQRNLTPGPRIALVRVDQTDTRTNGTRIDGPDAAGTVARAFIGSRDRECLLVIHLDTRHRLVSAEIASVGTIAAASVHPREVYKGAFLANAAAIICAHNHPSGDLEPSSDDWAAYRRLRKAGELLGVPLVDFLVVSSTETWSARSQGG